ncbi:PaaI family thioesterase [Mycolicibacterium sp. P9-22]|uniref:PaaI family thioesterase n=1 Tax=Mycolicibacterium sp. P9-22 TaxID=2024613 RepID=UPI00188369FC|nr:PaaI family thioesterase [Mycolicibacterium sp. P9-22]
MVLADHILGELPYLRRPSRTCSLTAELTLDVVGDLSNAEALVARAHNVTTGTESLTQCRITDQDDELLAVGSARCVYIPATAKDPHADDSAAPPPLSNSMNIEELLGLEYKHLSDSTEVTLCEPGGWVNGFGIMHGGVSACVTEVAASAHIQRANPDLLIAHVQTNFVRPVAVGAPYTAKARAHHVGRSSAVVEVLGFGGGGELCTVSTVTARRPGRHPRSAEHTS